MSAALHPADVLFAGEAPLPLLPAVDHYAGSEKLIVKALEIQQQLGPVVDVTCDCEDGARAGFEAEHALMCARLIASPANTFGRVGARVHDITHPHWREDLRILVSEAGERLSFITLPKARSVGDVAAQLAVLRALESEHALPRPIPVHVLIETHGALRDAANIAALPGVESLDFGLMDFVSAHQGAIASAAMQSPGQFDHPLIRRAKCEIVAAALGNGCVPTHNVTTELRDPEAVFQDALRARQEFGFLRMWSIHPDQIAPILRAMQPSFEDVAEAADILLAAQANAWGPIRHQGKLHDRASYRYYWSQLCRAQATGCTLPPAARDAFFSA
jgi:citrate lyase subunit beta/citryl-CoA lyase